MLLILALVRTVKGSVGMYKATKQWQPNRYMKLLAKDGILYFFVYVDFFFYPFVLPITRQNLPQRVVLLLTEIFFP